jgi:peptide/nickel transport system permease protein
MLKRLLWSLVTLLGTAVLTFLLTNLMPGDVARVIAGSKASPDVIEAIHAKYHLDDPAWKRLGFYLGQLAQGDLGRSYVTDQEVSEAIRIRFPATAALCGVAIVMWMGLAVPLGVLTARYRGSWFDRLVLVMGTIGLSLPAFWLARMLQYWLSYKLGWFPVAGFRGFRDLLLPALALAILAVGYYARLIHTNMIEALDSPAIRAARSRGIPESRVLFKHALRNAMIPVITVLGMDIAALLGGVLFVENIFALPGIGTLAVQSVFNLDVPMIMGTVMFSAALVVGTNLLVDSLYRFIDPRIKAGC